MIVRLSSRWSDKLLTLPETGMGYQRVNVLLKSGKVITDLVVENAEELNVPDDVEQFREGDIENIELSK